MKDPKVAEAHSEESRLWHPQGTSGPDTSRTTTSNVELVDLTETPIERVSPTGIRTSERDYDFDMIRTRRRLRARRPGAFDRIDVRGVDGRKLKERMGWKGGNASWRMSVEALSATCRCTRAPRAWATSRAARIDYNIDAGDRPAALSCDDAGQRIDARRKK